MCRVQNRVYVAADGTVIQTLEDMFPCHAEGNGESCQHIERMEDEFYDQMTDSEESDSKDSDMETEVGGDIPKPHMLKSKRRVNERRKSLTESEDPSSTYYSALSDVYYSTTSGVGPSGQRHR